MTYLSPICVTTNGGFFISACTLSFVLPGNSCITDSSNQKPYKMKKIILILLLSTGLLYLPTSNTSAQTIIEKKEKFDSIMKKHVDNPVTLSH